MKLKGGVLETVVAELEKNTAESEISIPDETVDTNTDIKDNRLERSISTEMKINANICRYSCNSTIHQPIPNGFNEYIEANYSETNMEINRTVNSCTDSCSSNIHQPIPNGHNEYIEGNANDMNVRRAKSEFKTNLFENSDEHLNKIKIQHKWQQKSRASKRNDAYMSDTVDNETESLISQTEKINAKQQENNDIENDSLIYHTVVENSHSPDPNMQLTDEDFNVDLNTSQQVFKLTQANLKQHTRSLKDHNKRYHRTKVEYERKKHSSNSIENVMDEHIESTNESSEYENRPNTHTSAGASAKIVSEMQNHDVEQTAKFDSNSKNESIDQFSENVVRSSSKISLNAKVNTPQLNQTDGLNIASSLHSCRLQNDMNLKKSPQPKRDANKKEKISLDNVETLISREKCSKSKNRKRPQNKRKGTDLKSQVQDTKLVNDDSGIEKDMEENTYYEENEHVDKHQQNNATGEGKAVVHKRLLKRVRQRRFSKRPMYDATNTSTNMILLNNKYGKNSRLWKRKENQPDRGKLINPQRHLKEPSFYLSGNFHSRCSSSENSQRYLPVTNLKLDFSDRPHSDKIGDRLYEARVSVNQNRHRFCKHSLPTLPKPLDFSPLTNQERSNRYVFVRERLYAEPVTRPSTSVRLDLRPVPELSEKNNRTPKVRIPHGMHAMLISETI